MIFWDCSVSESIQVRLLKPGANTIGPVTFECLAAIYQEPGVILASANTLKNIVALGEFFKDFAEKDISELSDKYGHYPQFDENDLIESFVKACKYIDQNYKKLSEFLNKSSTQEEFFNFVKNDPFFDEKNNPSTFDIKQASGYLMCAHAPFERFIIKKLESGYLLIPHSYLKKLNIDASLFKENQNDIDHLEIALGLKVNHLENVIINKIILDNQGLLPADCRKSFLNILKLMFVKKEDVKDLLDLKPWAIYWTSHGMLNQHYQDMLKELKTRRKKIESIEKEIAAWEKEYKQNEAQNPNYSKSTKGITLKNKIEAVRSNKFNLQLEAQNLHLAKNRLKPQVAGLTIKQFKQALKFFNEEIVTGFLFYTSCFAGGQLAIDAYKNETTNTLSSYSYPIATDSSFDVPTRKEFIMSPLGPYFNSVEQIFDEKSLKNLVIFSERRIAFKININYPGFFSQLENYSTKPTSYLTLFSNINPLLRDFKTRLKNKDWVEALPSIRFPGTTWFNTIELPKEVVQLTKVNVLARGSIPLVIDQNTNKKEAILLYTNNVPFEIEVKTDAKNHFPTITSMNPGTAIHTLQTINAPEFDITTVLLSFFPFNMFTGSKLFYIKKLNAINTLNIDVPKGMPYTFQDVMIVYNGKLREADSLSNYIFLKGPKQVYRYQWQAGASLPKNFTKDLSITLYTDYKDILLKYFKSRQSSTGEKFSGILEITEGQEQVNLTPVRQLFEQKAKLVQEFKLKRSILSLSSLTQTLTSLEAQSSRIKA